MTLKLICCLQSVLPDLTYRSTAEAFAFSRVLNHERDAEDTKHNINGGKSRAAVCATCRQQPKHASEESSSVSYNLQRG
jgi:recombinational DNA repair protein RecR